MIWFLETLIFSFFLFFTGYLNCKEIDQFTDNRMFFVHWQETAFLKQKNYLKLYSCFFYLHLKKVLQLNSNTLLKFYLYLKTQKYIQKFKS